MKEESECSSTSMSSHTELVFKKCLVCKRECKKKIKRCKDCKSGVYCSSKCREEHKSDHQKLCESIIELEKIEERKKIATVFSVREKNQVKLKLKNNMVKLIGEKPMIKCSVNGKKTEGLLDTGAMVSMGDKDWLAENAPECDVLSIEQFLEGDNLHLCAANNTNVDVEGVAIITLGLGSQELTVPFLITKDKLEVPIIGYNVIKHVVEMSRTNLPSLLQECIPSLSGPNAEAVVSLIQADTIDEETISVASKTVLPPNTRCRVKCRTRFEASEPKQNVAFTPNPSDTEIEMNESLIQVKLGKRNTHVVVTNPTNHPITLDRGLVLGSVESVSAIIPIGPADTNVAEIDNIVPPKVEGDPAGNIGKETSKNVPGEITVNVSSVGPADNVAEIDNIVPPKVVDLAGTDDPPPDLNQENIEEVVLPEIDLSHLTEEQRKLAQELLEEEKDVFCCGKTDHGDAPDLVMEINLTDNIPVVVPHRHIPRPLYDEVKNFVNDLIANKWVQESKSAYASPIVCVRKKDQSLRLCIDYRSLNKKIVPDKQPIPRIQEIFDGLGGQEWFSTLDMAKAYFQGYVAEKFRHITAFSTPWGLYEWIRIPMGISTAPQLFKDSSIKH